MSPDKDGARAAKSLLKAQSLYPSADNIPVSVFPRLISLQPMFKPLRRRKKPRKSRTTTCKFDFEKFSNLYVAVTGFGA